MNPFSSGTDHERPLSNAPAGRDFAVVMTQTLLAQRIGYFPLNLRTLVFRDSPKEECRDLFRPHQGFAFDSDSDHACADYRIARLREGNRGQTEDSVAEAASDRP
jgi:hypothetical protein